MIQPPNLILDELDKKHAARDERLFRMLLATAPLDMIAVLLNRPTSY